jgi:transposase
MSYAYSMDLRQRVIADCDRGLNTKAVALKYSVSPAWVRRLKQHRRERGDIVPRTGGGSRGCKFDRQKLAQLVAEQPDATLVELRDRLGVKVSPWAISKALRQLGLSFKKRRSTPPSRTGRMSPSVAPTGASRSSDSIRAS